MSNKEITLTSLLGIQGWNVKNIRYKEDDIMGKDVVVTIERDSDNFYVCSECGASYFIRYDTLPPRLIKDFPIWGRKTYLELSFARVYCEQCKKVVIEKLPFIEKYQRITLRYELYVAQLCDLLPIVDIKDLEELNKDMIYKIDRKWLERRKALRENKPVRLLGIDEIAIKKGHKYATVFYDLERKEVIGLVKSRKQRAVSGFFRRWGKNMCKGVEAVCMDLWSAFKNSVSIYCKKATIVFDKFHIYKYLHDGVDKVRRHEVNKEKASDEKIVKGTKWLWLKKNENLKRKEKATLKEIMILNENMCKAYILKEDFENFYLSKSKEEGNKFIEEWMQRCVESGLEEFKKLAKRINRWKEGILTYFEYKISNGVSEGINNKIKVLKRKAYGFHDVEYFFNKILMITNNLPSLNVAIHKFTE